jgi:nicotinamidase/pyrazinamidase
MNNILIRNDDALIIVDPQLDFMPGGALAVAGGDEIVEGINDLIQQFKSSGALIAITQDWHPQGHKSFASAHGVDPFSSVELSYGTQVAWPDHCVQGSAGAEFHAALGVDAADVIIRKGMNPNVDSYSAFYENDKVTKTGLAGFLRDKGVKRCFFVGLAYDFCVGYSALDARREGFNAIVLKDLTRAIRQTVNTGVTAEKLTTEDLMDRQLTEAGAEVHG